MNPMRGGGCEAVRGSLGEWLAGALEGEAARAVEAHVQTCDGCSRALADLGALEAALRSAAFPAGPGQAAPPRGRPRSRLARAAVGLALAAGVAVAALVWRSPLPPGRGGGGAARVLYGARAGTALAPGETYAAGSPAVLELADGSLVALAPAARLAAMAPRAARLEAGEAVFHIQQNAQHFLVELPLGTVIVLGTTFRVSIEEESMSRMGSVLMNPRAAWALTATIAVASGVVLYRAHDGSASTEIRAGERAVVQAGSVEVGSAGPGAAAGTPALEEARAELAKAMAAAEALRRENEELRAARDMAEKAKADAEKKLAALAPRARPAGGERAPGEAPPPGAPAPSRKGVAIDFGPHAAIPEVAGADWREMAQAASNMTGLLRDLVAQNKSLDELSPELTVAIGMENMKLVKFALAARGKLPTHAFGNGEFTHPIATANMMAEHLKLAGLPLSAGQIAEIAGFGEDYDAEWLRAQGTYTGETLALEKVMDELELKLRFVGRAMGALTPEQRAVVAPPEVHDRASIDLYSPLLILLPYARPVGRPSPTEIRDLVAAEMTPAVSADVARALADAWIAENAPRFEPVDREDVPFYRSADAVTAGRATIKLRKELLAMPGIPDEARTKLRDGLEFAIPRLLKPGGGG